MVQLTVNIRVNTDDTNEAEKWLEELAENEMFEFDVIQTKVV